MECKKRSDWLRIQPMRHSESVFRTVEFLAKLDITIWAKYDSGNYDMRLTIIIMP